MTSERVLKLPREVATSKRGLPSLSLGAERDTRSTSAGLAQRTPAASHSCLSIAMICVALSSQKSWPSVFS
jgi:hypothetical protein